MSRLFFTLSLLICIPSFASVTKLECYERFYSAIEKLDAEIINGYTELFNKETTLLDQYFNPGDYYQGPHNYYKHNKKVDILNTRDRYQKWLYTRITKSRALSTELAYCLKYSSN